MNYFIYGFTGKDDTLYALLVIRIVEVFLLPTRVQMVEGRENVICCRFLLFAERGRDGGREFAVGFCYLLIHLQWKPVLRFRSLMLN